MDGYSARDVASLLGLTVGQIRTYVRSGFLEPARGKGGKLAFSFQDLVLLRTAKGLLAARIPARRVRRALDLLRRQLPKDRPLTGVHIRAEGDRIVVRDGAAAWHPESGQILFDFDVDELARAIAPLEEPTTAAAAADEASVDALYEKGCRLEEQDLQGAMAAYREALAISPDHADANINLGRLLHDAGQVATARSHYEQALSSRPDDAVAAFNLGVALEDLGDIMGAVVAYQQALATDNMLADAHHNLGRLLEQQGKMTAALRHISAYRRLTKPRS